MNFVDHSRRLRRQFVFFVAFSMCPATLVAQAVCLPAPRLLTTMPMGGQAGEEFELAITGQYIEDASSLRFSDPRITANAKLDSKGMPEKNKYVVKIAENCPPGIYEASVMTRLGLSTSRVFTVGSFPEVSQTKPSAKVETAMPLELNSVCNAVMPARAINFYSFQAKQGQRVIVDCAARGIDSKLNAVLVVADSQGRDLAVERRGGAIDFVAPEAGTYIVKVHELTFKGGPDFFYRLVLREANDGEVVPRHPSTRAVNSFSWPPTGIAETAAQKEVEPNDLASEVQKITLPCDISGAFATAADVDTFEFTAKKGDVWWVEVASERLGRPTDPSVIVQRVEIKEGIETLTDVAELTDIPSPVKVSSNGYAYDGPPYQAGSSDVLGKIEIKQDGTYRLRLSDLFGGTRNDPGNVYRLIVRQAAPDFALVSWALHMQLRNGDRNALSKPIALRAGATMALEVVVIRRDGFNGDIELVMENLPDGVTAQGLKIAAGKNRGIMLVTAAEGAPTGYGSAKFFGRAKIGDNEVTRPCRLASMAWPIVNHWSDVPSPRLLADVSVSVSNSEPAPITIAARESKVWEAKQGQKLTIPLIHLRRGKFSGAIMAAKGMGDGFEKVKFDLPLDKDSSEAVLDLAALKTPPGDYLIAFYGGAVAKYQYNPNAAIVAEEKLRVAEQQLASAKATSTRIASEVKAAGESEKGKLQEASKVAANDLKTATSLVAAAKQQVKTTTAQAKAKDIVDIVVSEPIRIRVQPAEKK